MKGHETPVDRLIFALFTILSALVSLVKGWGTAKATAAIGELRLAVEVLTRAALPPATSTATASPPRPSMREVQRLRFAEVGAELVEVRRVLDDLTLTALDATREPEAQAFSAHAATIRTHAVDVLQHVRSAELVLEELGEARLVVGVLDDTVQPPVVYADHEGCKGGVYDELIMVKWSAGPKAAMRHLNAAIGGVKPNLPQ